MAFPGVAQAAPGDNASTNGTVSATIVESISVAGSEDLRFGLFETPQSNGTLTVDAQSGAATASPALAGSADLSQLAGGRGPASFNLQGSPDRVVYIELPQSVQLINDTATMELDSFNSNNNNGSVKLDNSGYFKLLIGGRLNVSAGQPSGGYTGSFKVTVLYE